MRKKHGSAVNCRLGCEWWMSVGREPMQIVQAIHLRNAHEIKCLDSRRPLTTAYGYSRMAAGCTEVDQETYGLVEGKVR